jgi:cytochrome c5
MMRTILLGLTGAALAISLNAAVASDARSGGDIVAAVCHKCHESGEKGAPRIGNLADWGPRMSKGISSLTGHAVRGFRGMPAHGGELRLTDLEMTRAIIFMIIPKSGAHATLEKSLVVPELSGKKLYDMRCHECHATGRNGAPKVGDYRAWGPRIEKGMDALVESAINGHNKMPSRGGFASASDEELRSVVDYMLMSVSTSFAEQQVKAAK